MPKRSSKQVSKKKVSAEQAATDELDAAQDRKTNKNPAAVALGRLGGKKGGPARAAKLSKQRRSAIARKAALARWSKSK